MSDVRSIANAVLLPAIDHLKLTDELKRYFESGGKAILLGESRAEYVARAMSTRRIAAETNDQFQAFVGDVKARAGASLVAADLEPGGIQRLHKLVPAFPPQQSLAGMSASEIVTLSRQVAVAAKALGVNMALAPIVDVVTGHNAWLHDRTLGVDPHQVARIANACVAGFQSGGMIAAAKHFPGHHDISGDPAVEAALVNGSDLDMAPGFLAFESVIQAGVAAIMTGPALVPALDPELPSSVSRKTVDLLRGRFGFTGLIVTDDLDSKATLQGRSVENTAILALQAGADLLLIAADGQIEVVASAIEAAVKSGDLDVDRLQQAAVNVQSHASKANDPLPIYQSLNSDAL